MAKRIKPKKPPVKSENTPVEVIPQEVENPVKILPVVPLDVEDKLEVKMGSEVTVTFSDPPSTEEMLKDMMDNNPNLPRSEWPKEDKVIKLTDLEDPEKLDQGEVNIVSSLAPQRKNIFEKKSVTIEDENPGALTGKIGVDERVESVISLSTLNNVRGKVVRGLLDNWNQAEKEGRMFRSLLGTALGDALGSLFGEFPKSASIIRHINAQVMLPEHTEPTSVWKWSDDTVAATAVVKTLYQFNGIDQDELSENLLTGFNAYPDRGFGGGFKKLMQQLNQGGDWRVYSKSLFEGVGSFGNGSAMRAAPIGAFLHDVSPEIVVQEATESAEVSHAHPEGIAGAVSVALAAYFVSQEKLIQNHTSDNFLITPILDLLPKSETRDALARICGMDRHEHPSSVAELYGTGLAPKSTKISTTAQHTVPFCIWMAQRAIRERQSFIKAMWEVLGGLGDTDTTCAIVGGILACDGRIQLPQEWIDHLEPMPKF